MKVSSVTLFTLFLHLSDLIYYLGTIDGLGSQPISDLSSTDAQARAEENQKLFHWTRMQASIPQEKIEPVAPTEPEESQFFQSNFLASMSSMQEGEKGILKQLNNDLVFPTLGGGGESHHENFANVKDAVWGVVKENPNEECKVNHSNALYLGSTYLSCSELDGPKPGYVFQIGSKGAGWYWVGPSNLITKTEEVGIKKTPTSVIAPASVPTSTKLNIVIDKETIPEPGRPEDEKSEQAKREAEEKAILRREKKAEKERKKSEWLRKQQEAIEREKLSEKETETTSDSVISSVAAEPEVGAENRFSGLKKKKKKKA